LALVDNATWSFFASDVYIFDELKLALSETAWYNIQFQVAKWQHQEVFPNVQSDQRYAATLTYYGNLAYFNLTDTQANIEPTEEPAPQVDVSWYLFGLSEAGKVPAWRQALFGAATLLTSMPAAAVVLISAGFEAFFNETMRIAWAEDGLDTGSFDRLASRNVPISGLVDWLPATVRRPSFRDAGRDLRGRWEQLVNRRRNDVVHRADVHVTSEQAMDSMRAALDRIVFFDPAALVRPHAYYVNR